MDQGGGSAGSLRFVLSLRATGEGHVSSITFRTGIIHPDNEIEIDPPELGRLNIRLTRTNGEVSARITATEAGTLELLQNELQDLRDSLAESGCDSSVSTLRTCCRCGR